MVVPLLNLQLRADVLNKERDGSVLLLVHVDEVLVPVVSCYLDGEDAGRVSDLHNLIVKQSLKAF